MNYLDDMSIVDKRQKALKVVRVITFICILLAMFMIYKLSADSGIESSKMSRGLLDLLNKVVEMFTGRNIQMTISASNYAFIELCLRKLAHMFIFCVLSMSVMLFLFTFKIGFIFRIIITLFTCFGYACLDEFHQSFVVGRGPSFKDALIDTTGSVIGIVLSLIVFSVIFTLYTKYQENKIKEKIENEDFNEEDA